MFVMCSWLVGTLGCGQISSLSGHSIDEKDVSSDENESTAALDERGISKDDAKEPKIPQPKDQTFPVEFGGLSFTAKLDSKGYVTILDYPSEWVGKAKITRFDGEEKSPFSKEHCDGIKAMNKHGGGGIVRTAFHSVLKFDVPPFLSTGFIVALRETAQKAGIYMPATELKNPVQRSNGKINLNLSDASISLLLGSLGELNEQLDLRLKGMENDDMEYTVIVRAGDVLCDLVSGDATMTMFFPIEDEAKVIKVTYNRLEVKL
jgi:hypothetical protein